MPRRRALAARPCAAWRANRRRRHCGAGVTPALDQTPIAALATRTANGCYCCRLSDRQEEFQPSHQPSRQPGHRQERVVWYRP